MGIRRDWTHGCYFKIFFLWLYVLTKVLHINRRADAAMKPVSHTSSVRYLGLIYVILNLCQMSENKVPSRIKYFTFVKIKYEISCNFYIYFLMSFRHRILRVIEDLKRRKRKMYNDKRKLCFLNVTLSIERKKRCKIFIKKKTLIRLRVRWLLRRFIISKVTYR